MAYFKLWADEAMTRLFGAAVPSGRLKGVAFEKNGQSVDFQMFLGAMESNVKLENASQPGVGDVLLAVEDAVAERSAARVCAQGELLGRSGWLYRVETAGTLAAGSVTWPQQAGGQVTDGTAVLRCLGRKHQVSAVRLALSQAGLDSAVGGADLVLGKTLNGGAALAVWVRVSNAVAELYDASSEPSMRLYLKNAAESAV